MRKTQHDDFKRRDFLRGLFALSASHAFPRRGGSIFRRAAAEITADLNVLFIGNSYTSRADVAVLKNDLPGMLSRVAASDRVDPTAIFTDSLTKGGAHLDELLRLDSAGDKFAERKWDYIVLQEYSLWAMSRDGRERAKQAFGKWAEEVRAIGAQPLIYETWMREPGSDWYKDNAVNDARLGAIKLVDPGYMHHEIAEHTREMAQLFGVKEIPVGDFWARACREARLSSLYDPSDHTHPSADGTYLSSLVFYRYLTGHSPENVGYEPPGVASSAARQLRHIAAGD